MAKVRLEGIRKVFGVPDGEEVAVERIDTEIADERLTAILGPSGCGKTTLLRMIAGLETPSEGRISFDDRDVTDIRVQERGVSMVFQNIALFPFKSVRKNIAYGLKYEDVPSDEVAEKVTRIAANLGIEPFLDQMPNQLSGGQQQRVALGRALIRNPDVFLLDEPMSNLDERIRIDLRSELKELQRELSTTTVYVTHNQEQAMALSDEILVLNDGRIEQQGTPTEIFDRPANTFVAEFIGSPRMNLFGGELDGYRLRIDGTDLEVELPPDPALDGTEGVRDVTVGLRPSKMRLTESSSDAKLAGEVEIVERLGEENVAHLACPGFDRTVQVQTPDTDIPEGRTVGIKFDPADVHLFDGATGEAIVNRIAEPPTQ